jgi:translation initiation factor 2 subunit 3
MDSKKTKQQPAMSSTNSTPPAEMNHHLTNRAAMQPDSESAPGPGPGSDIEFRLRVSQTASVAVGSSEQKTVRGSADAIVPNSNQCSDNKGNMYDQPTINVGMIGHVAHGKSTLTKALSGVSTQKFYKERKQNMTIKLGYANVKLWRCSDTSCPRPMCYQATGSSVAALGCRVHGCCQAMKLVRHISIVDSPGHHDLMATMLSGAAVMDASILVIAANEPCPCPQTEEHLAAAQIMGFARQCLVVQNKVDLVQPHQAHANHAKITKFVAGTDADSAPIIPVCAQLGFNTDVVVQYLAECIQDPIRDTNAPARMLVIRSFDINKPCRFNGQFKGGVLGGSLQQGRLHVHDRVEIRPGIILRDGSYSPLVGEVTSLLSEKTKLQSAVPGGLLGIGLTVDPAVAGKNRMVGQVMGHVGTLPPVFCQVTVKYKLMKRTVTSDSSDQTTTKTGKISSGEMLLICIGSARVECIVNKMNKTKRIMQLETKTPVCASLQDKAAIFRDTNHGGRSHHWRLIGIGCIVSLIELEPAAPLALIPLSASRSNSAGAHSHAIGSTVSDVESDSKTDVSLHLQKNIMAVDVDKENCVHSAVAVTDQTKSLSIIDPVQSVPLLVDKASELEEIPTQSDDTSTSTIGKSSFKTDFDMKQHVHSAMQMSSFAELKLQHDADNHDGHTAITDDSFKFDRTNNACRMYEAEYPQVGEYVMVQVTKIDINVGAYCELLEYNGLHALIPVNELSRSRIRSIKQVVQLHHRYVTCVLHVDSQRNHIDLSKKRVHETDQSETEEWFMLSKQFHAILTRVSVDCKVSLSTVCNMLGWPLYDLAAELADEVTNAAGSSQVTTVTSHPVSLIRHALQDPSALLPLKTKLGVHLGFESDSDHMAVNAMLDALIYVAQFRLALKPMKIRCRLQLNCFAENGAVLLLKALKQACKELTPSKKQARKTFGTDEVPFEMHIAGAPFVVLHTDRRNCVDGIAYLEHAANRIIQLVHRCGGVASIVEPPAIV